MRLIVLIHGVHLYTIELFCYSLGARYAIDMVLKTNQAEQNLKQLC